MHDHLNRLVDTTTFHSNHVVDHGSIRSSSNPSLYANVVGCRPTGTLRHLRHHTHSHIQHNYHCTHLQLQPFYIKLNKIRDEIPIQISYL
jgi:hypothetical protein